MNGQAKMFYKLEVKKISDLRKMYYLRGGKIE